MSKLSSWLGWLQKDSLRGGNRRSFGTYVHHVKQSNMCLHNHWPAPINKTQWGNGKVRGKGPTFSTDLFPQAPVPQMHFAGKGYMFLSELIGLAFLISSLETCIPWSYTCLISHKMQLTGVMVTRCVKVGKWSCPWKVRSVLQEVGEMRFLWAQVGGPWRELPGRKSHTG